MPDALDIDRVIYLDCDIICQSVVLLSMVFAIFIRRYMERKAAAKPAYKGDAR